MSLEILSQWRLKDYRLKFDLNWSKTINVDRKWDLHVPKASWDVMIFQHRPVVIQKRRIAAGHYMKIVCGPSVLVIVNNRCHKSGENLEIGQPILQRIIYQSKVTMHSMRAEWNIAKK